LIICVNRVDHTREIHWPWQRFFRSFRGSALLCSNVVAIGKQKHMSAFYREKVLSVRHWTDSLFSFRATRDSGFRFQNGQFAMIGLEVDGRPLLRAYSMASANHEQELEFFSIKVADGPLTSRLQKIKEGDIILVGRKATGTLVTDNLLSGNRLLLLSTGTGLAPFASLIKDPDVYDRFETIVLVHGCRQVSELAYGEEVVAKLRDDELFGPLLSEKLVYYPTVTREPFRNRGRITDLITSEQLFNDIGQSPLDIDSDRIMMCGSPAMLEELRAMFEAKGFAEGSSGEPGHFVIEKAFVER
jgi:ferredoxin--NADP+ reductase